jgi:enoyl-CoA hydratase/carnithine racemase
MSYQYLQVTREATVITITLNRPDQRNALSLALMRELTDALQAVAAGDALGVILAANGPVFSAGHHFADMAGASSEQVQALFDTCIAMMNTVQAMPQPVVARVHALATAAGCQLVATCDMAVAADSAGFALPGGKGGMFCHTPLVAVARTIGRKRALEMAMTGDAIDAATAAHWGLVNKVVPATDLEAATLDLVRRATRGSAGAKALGKQVFYQQIGLPQDLAYQLAGRAMADAALTPDGQEGFAAFLGKREARYRPR